MATTKKVTKKSGVSSKKASSKKATKVLAKNEKKVATKKTASKQTTTKKVVKKPSTPVTKKVTVKQAPKKPNKPATKKVASKKVAVSPAKKSPIKKTNTKNSVAKRQVTLGKKVSVTDVLVYNKPRPKKDKLVTTTTVQRQSDIDRKKRLAKREADLAKKLTAKEKRELEKAKAKAEAILNEAKQRENERRYANSPEALLAKREEELKKLAEELRTREMELKSKELLNEKGEVVPVAPSKLEELEAVLAKNKKVMEEKFKERESEIKRRRLMEEEATNRLYMLRADITRDLEDLKHDVQISIRKRDELDKEVRALEKEVKLYQIKISSKNAELTIIEEHRDEHFDLNTTEIDAEKLDLTNKLAIAQAALEEKQQALLLVKNNLVDKEKHLSSKTEAGEKEIIEAEMALEDLKKHLDINKMIDVIAYDNETSSHLEKIVNKNLSAVANVKEENVQQDGYKTVMISLKHSKFEDEIVSSIDDVEPSIEEPKTDENVDTEKKVIAPIVPFEPESNNTPVIQTQNIDDEKKAADEEKAKAKEEASASKEASKAESKAAKEASKNELKEYLNQDEKVGNLSIKRWVALLISGGVVTISIVLIFVLGFIL